MAASLRPAEIHFRHNCVQNVNKSGGLFIQRTLATAEIILQCVTSAQVSRRSVEAVNGVKR